MTKTSLYQVYLLEKPEPTLLPGGEFTSNPLIDPKIIVGPVTLFAVNNSVAAIKATQIFADEIKDIDPNRLGVIIVPMSEPVH